MEMKDQILPVDWRWVRLGEVCKQDRQIVAPDSEVATRLPYLGLEDIESETGRIIASVGDEAENGGQSTAFLFDSRHVLYGKLRPYLNKVALPDTEGRCTTELIPLLPQSVDRTFLAWLLRRRETVDAAMRDKTGSRMPRANMNDLLELLIPLPPRGEQERIAATISKSIQMVERARAATEAQVEAAKALPAAYLCTVFSGSQVQGWPRKRLEEFCDLLPAKSITTFGDCEVMAITTACLTEIGFQPSGVKSARMWSKDAAECVVSNSEILMARSNTPELVGRVAMFSGQPKDVVASDLTIRIRCRHGVDPQFMTAYLSWLYLSGYWKERAGGASGSMKKITRTQIQREQIPIPPDSDQRRIASQLSEQMAATERLRRTLAEQLDAINALPAALLRKAFSGGL